ncbi:unnamed protein product [Blepharisma stoltei]|uniref:Uncharacterized protein n=1 Tax=Blepharisma stoltei TaxID=1481888 RepID=A0AAU9KAD9_9CILI|nr:unnamed protein product [Blepharisma stoltei]
MLCRQFGRKSLAFIIFLALVTSLFWIGNILAFDSEAEQIEEVLVPTTTAITSSNHSKEIQTSEDQNSPTIAPVATYDEADLLLDILPRSSLHYNISWIKSTELQIEASIPGEEIACVPSTFGYTKEQAENRYKYMDRAFSCGSESDTAVMIEDNKLIVNCPSYTSPTTWAVGNVPWEELFGNVRLVPRWNNYKGREDIGDAEFGYVKCGTGIKQAFLQNKFSRSASHRAQSTREIISDSLNLKEKPKPLTVMVLYLDSVSRKHFYRALRKTAAFFNSSIASGAFSDDYVIYDFLINNAHGENTAPNITPLTYGHSLPDHQKFTKGWSVRRAQEKAKYEELQKRAIWKHYEKMGFVTMFGFETKGDYFAEITGRKILCDHVATSFWRGSTDIMGYNEYSEKQRCIGNYYSHHYMFQYAWEYVNNYKGHNKFSYMHILAGHEGTGSVIKTVDEDLLKFVKQMLEFHRDNNEDIAFIVGADHGLHVGPWDKIEEGLMENLLPFSFLISNKELIAKLGPETHEILQHNTNRLIGKLDWHLTLKHLAAAPYGNLDTNSKAYKEWKKSTNSENAISLIMEKVKDSRTCEDIRINLYWCTCLKYEEFDRLSSEEESGIVQRIAETGIEAINRKISKDKAGEYCMSVSLAKIIKTDHEITNSKVKHYKVDIKVNEHPDFIFRVIAQVMPSSEMVKYKKQELENQVYPTTSLESSQGKLDLQVQNVVRVDNTNEICMEVGNSVKGKDNFCVCKGLKDFNIPKFPNGKVKVLLENFKKKLNIFVGEVSQSCKETCQINGKVCEEWGLSVVNNFDLMNESWREIGSNSYFVTMDNETLFFKNLRVSERTSGDIPGLVRNEMDYKFVEADWNSLSCNNRSEHIRAFCPCSRF